MNKKSAFTIIFLLFIFLAVSLTFSQTSHAEWVDDWLDQEVSVNPSYFEGQKRGYFTAGSYAARWPETSDHLFTIVPPSLRFGCGGIDGFLGSFSFLDFEYLVEKMQRIVQAAPALAFDIALNTLAEQVATSMKGFESIIDILNAVQLNDCAAARWMLDETGISAEIQKQSARLGEAVTKTEIYSGARDFFHGAAQTIKGNKGRPTGDVPLDVITLEGCHEDIQDVFGMQGSVLDHLAAKIGIDDDSFVDLIRGFVGDALIQKDEITYHVEPVGPCPENKLDFNLILEGKAQAKNIAGKCNDIPDTNKKLQQYVAERMLAISSSIKTGDALDEDDQDFINSMALPLHSIMKMAVGAQQEGAIVSLLADVAAKAYAYQLLSDLFHVSFHLLTKGELLIKKQADQPKEGRDPEQCTLTFFEPAKKEISRMKNDLFTLLQSARSAYSTAASEVNAILVLVEKMHTFNEIAYDQISQSFGQDVARRLNVKSN